MGTTARRGRGIGTAGLVASLMLTVVPAGTRAEDAPPGRLVEVGSHRMHLYCTGHGHPAVILDAGLGGSTADWSLLQPLVSRYTTVCSYDRAGYGWSEASERPRSSSHIAEELHELLQRAKVKPPYILVGHSFGGFNVRVFAARHPGEVAGLVLIDASHEAQFERFEREFGVNLAPRRNGHVRLSPPRIPRAVPVALREVAMRRATRVPAMLAVRNELLNFRRSAEEVRRELRLPDVPLVVLTRGVQQWRDAPRSAEMERLWLELQHSLVHLTTDRDHIIAGRSGHYIHLDQPELVSAAIEQVVRRNRGGRVSWRMLARHGARLY